MIQDDKEISTELHVDLLRKLRVFHNREVPVLEGWAVQRISAETSEMLVGIRCITSKAIRIIWIVVAGYLEGGGVDCIAGAECGRAGKRVADDVRATIELS